MTKIVKKYIYRFLLKVKIVNQVVKKISIKDKCFDWKPFNLYIRAII